MRNLRDRLTAAAADLWRGSAPLTATGGIMCVALLVSALGLALDPRTITGAPAWLKPAKFAVSTGIYSLTLAWVFLYLPEWPRLRARVGWITAAIFLLEVAIVDGQAWRGTTSHFNVGTPLDGVLFAVMGVGIALQTFGSVFVAVALWRQRFADRAMGAALRAGMIITIAGAASAGLMTKPTAAQLEDARTTGRLVLSGAHTVGAPDGGPGLSGTGWSVQHGDLRVPHFVGLHALQILPVVALFAGRRRESSTAAAAVRAVAASHAMLFGILLLQALRGEALVAPGPATVTLLAVWAVVTIASLVRALRPNAAADHQQPAAFSR